MTIDKATKISLGIMVLLISSAAGGAIHLSTLNANVGRVDETLKEVRQAVERIDRQVIQDGKSFAIQQTRMETMHDQLKTLERRVRDLEKK